MASVFSGKAGRQTAIYTQKMAQEQLDRLIPIYQHGWQMSRNALSQGFGKAPQYLNRGYWDGRRDVNRGAWNAQSSIRQGRDQGLGYLEQGLGDLRQRYGQGAQQLDRAVSAYDPLIAEGMKGYGMLSNALGLGGAEGNAAARQAFQAGPGYEWQVEQASEAAQRAANRIGMTYSGNTTDAITRLGSNLANQEWQTWIGNLQPYQQAAHSAVGGQAQVLNQLAALYQAQGKDEATIRGQQGSMAYNAGTAIGSSQQQQGDTLGGMAVNWGQNRSQIPVAHAQSLANTFTGEMTNVADTYNQFYKTVTEAGQQGLMAGQQAAANRFGAMMGGLNMASGFLGKLFG